MHEAEAKSHREKPVINDWPWNLHDDCPEGAFCKRRDEMFARSSRLPALGDENDSWNNGFCDYTYQITCRTDFGHLRASFEVRKVWLSLAPATMRYGFSGIEGTAWNDSLDEKMRLFVERALTRLTPDAIEEAMRAEIEKAKIDGGGKLIKEAAQRLTKEAEGLAAEMQGYADGLVKRSDDVHDTYDELVQVQGLINAQGGITSDDEAAHLLELDSKLRSDLADGMHIQAHVINHSFPDLIQEAQDWDDAKKRDEHDDQLRQQYPHPGSGGTWGNINVGNINFGNIIGPENVQQHEVSGLSFAHLPVMQSQHDIEGGFDNDDLAGLAHLWDDAGDHGSVEGEVDESQRVLFDGSEDEGDDQSGDEVQEDDSGDEVGGEDSETAGIDLGRPEPVR